MLTRDFGLRTRTTPALCASLRASASAVTAFCANPLTEVLLGELRYALLDFTLDGLKWAARARIKRMIDFRLPFTMSEMTKTMNWLYSLITQKFKITI